MIANGHKTTLRQFYRTHTDKELQWALKGVDMNVSMDRHRAKIIKRIMPERLLGVHHE